MTSAEPAQSPILYGRFSARLRAFYIDVIVILVTIAAGLTIAAMSNSQTISRIVGFSLATALILLEPILVSVFGSSVGHYFSNLRVVDNRTGGRVSFIKAVTRTVIKAVLGLYSFVSMLTTSRHQALHDWLTASTVQIRNEANARPSDYVHERIELRDPRMPSRTRRFFVTAGYVVLIFILSIPLELLMYSNDCNFNDVCSQRDKVMILIKSALTLVVMFTAVTMGWRGKLYGARMRRADAAQS